MYAIMKYIMMVAISVVSFKTYAAPVFQSTLPQLGSNLNEFHRVYTERLNGLIPGEKKTAADIKKIIHEPFYKITREFFNKDHFVAKNVQGLRECKLFEYCSVCNQSDKLLDEGLKNAVDAINKDQAAKALLATLDAIIAGSSTSIPLTKDKNYIPPKSVKDLLMTGFKDHALGKTHLNKDYLLLNMITFLTLFENMSIAPVNHTELVSFFSNLFTDDTHTIFQETLSCPLVAGIAPTPQPSPTTPKKSTSPTGKEPPYKHHEKKSKGMLFDFMESVKEQQ